jgi:hypothetical protein
VYFGIDLDQKGINILNDILKLEGDRQRASTEQHAAAMQQSKEFFSHQAPLRRITREWRDPIFQIFPMQVHIEGNRRVKTGEKTGRKLGSKTCFRVVSRKRKCEEEEEEYEEDEEEEGKDEGKEVDEGKREGERDAAQQQQDNGSEAEADL